MKSRHTAMREPRSQRRRRLRGPLRGVVYIEVILSLIPVFIAFLGITQLALLKIGGLVVQHAATRAARAAIVILDDDPQYYGDAARGDLNAGETEESGLDAALTNIIQEYDSATGGESYQAGARLKAIQGVAHHSLAVLSPPLSFERHLAAQLDGSLTRLAVGRLIYAPAASAVTLHEPGQEEPTFATDKRQKLVVRVTFLMPCSVPWVSAFMCTSREDLINAIGDLEGTDDAEAIHEALKYSNNSILSDLSIIAGNRFTVLRAEASFVAQGASYMEGG
jgi:hypothetical protein